VWDGNALADVGGEILLAVEHALHIALIDVAACNQHLACRRDRLLAADRGEPDLDVFLQQDAGTDRLRCLRLCLRCGRTCLHSRFLEARGDDLIDIVLRKIAHPDMLRLRRVRKRALCELFMRDNELCLGRDCANRAVRDGDVRIAVLLELFAQRSRTEGGGTHACVAGVDDDLQILARDLLLRREILAAILHVAHALGCGLERLILDILRHLDEDGGDSAGYRRRNGKRREVCKERRAARGHGNDRKDRARRGRCNQTAAEEAEREDAGHAARNRSDDEHGLHEDVREIDFVNTTENVDDHGARRGRLRHALAEEPVGEQDTKTRARVRLEQEEHGLAVFLRLLNAERAEHAVIERVVEEEHLCRLDDDGCERQQPHCNDRLDAAAQNLVRTADDRLDDGKGNHRKDAAKDADGEVVHEHFKAARNAVADRIIEFLDDPAAQRSHNHRAEEHRNLRARDDARRCNRCYDAATMSIDRRAAAVGDEQRNQPLAHGTADLCEVFVRHPPRRDEQRGQKAPCDKCADVRHNHSGQETTKFLHGLLCPSTLLTHHNPP